MRPLSRLGFILLAFLNITSFVAPISATSVTAQQNFRILELSVHEAAGYIQADKGQVVVVLLYASWCPACRNFFPGLLQFADAYQHQRVDIFALSMDDTMAELEDYLSGYDLTILPMWLTPWPEGELTKALAGLSITYDQRIPFLAILDKKGRLVYQGRASIDALTRAVNTALRT